MQKKEGHPHMQDCLLIPAQAQDWNKSKRAKSKKAKRVSETMALVVN